MKFFYGYDDNHYVNITPDVFSKCFRDDGIFIPSGDGERCQIIGYDPYPNILKHIMIEDHTGKRHIYTHIKEAHIHFNSLSKQLDDDKNPKIWWNKIGRFIEDPVERLTKLQKHFNLIHMEWGGFEIEYPEQLMIMRYLNENSKVLEIGGHIGRTAHIIQTIINNPKNHVVMEADKRTAQKLRENLDFNSFKDTIIETACLSKVRLYMTGGGANAPRHFEINAIPPNTIEVETISYSDLCKKHNIDFDTLVADCEGSLYYIFKEDPDMLNNINLVIMENDYDDIDHKQMVDAILKIKGFKCVYTEKGVSAAAWSCCYNFFYEVWKKV